QSTSGSVCKLVLGGLQPADELLCCEDNLPCLASSPICSSTNKLTRCFFINKLGACERNDTLAKTVCQYQDGVYCLKGETDIPYDEDQLGGWNVIYWIFARYTAIRSVNGYTDEKTGPLPGAPPPAPAAPPPPGGELPSKAPKGLQNPSSMVCSDSMASGICQIKDDSGYKNFNYIKIRRVRRIRRVRILVLII
ncbi:21200_t:CDS:2, partial [Rhizophagus irregularis]